jgi:metallo-beta-lactamase class B
MKHAARILITFLLASAALGQKSDTTRKWNEPVAPFRIAGNLFYVGAVDITSFLIVTPDGLIVIEGGLEETAPQILANIRTLGFDPKQVKLILSSHAHFDHAGGIDALRRATGAKVVAGALDAPLLARGGLDDPQFGNQFPFTPIWADRLVRDGDRISLGGTTIVARHTPGHTRGCTTWTTRIRDGKRTYEAVFVGSPSAPSEYRLTDNRRYPDAVADYRRQFATLRSLPCDLFLATHGSFFDLTEKRERLAAGAKTNPFVDPDGYRAFVARAEQTIEARIAKEQAGQ